MSTVAAAAVSAPAIQRVSPSPPPLPTQQQIVGGNAIAGVVGVPPVAGGGGGFSNSSLYVGDLHPAVNEDELFEIFGQVVPVTSVRVCRDLLKRSSLGYAYVNFNNSQDAVHAMEVLNFYHVRGKPIRIMLSHRDPSIRKSGYANVFIKNLDESIDNKALHDTFGAFGTILSCKVATDSNGRSKGYGFIQYDQEEEAQRAIDHLNGMLLNDKQVYVGLFVRRQERSVKFTNVYVKNLAETITDEEMNNLFGKYGPITSAVVMRDATGKSRGFGFVNFQNPDDAASAVDNLNGSTFDDKVLYVGKAQRKAEREAELKAKFEQERNGRFEKLQGANLYLKNIDDNINDEKLKELFSEFGTITSCKVMLDPHGQSRGSGFVAFSTPEEASRAVNEMNGKMIGRKPLYVAVAQRKEERKARLQAQFAQLRAPGAMTLAIPSNVPGYHPGTPRLGPPQLYYGQGTPGLIPPQPAGYGFQQQLMPGIRPGVGPNFMIPYHLQRQGQPGQRMGVRRGGPPQQMQQQQQMVRNANQGYRYNARNNGVDPAAMLPQGLVSPVMPMPIDVAGIPSVVPVDGNRPSPLTLASALASATPEHQRMILGEQLFPLVERLEPDNAGKVTGMLLEMDQTEVLHLVESPDALKKKVAEAMEVLRMASDNASEVDQFGSLSLND
ncbi:Polyadenylate-binding protein 5 [Acorus gramineus]|uniref:Polyadenylate-binding protein n=1 Tax=Acorus gramineus TaxID=55184 RepID=A0AAV9AL00_ACOGR|nr:Polyadenylate-binding protein 5 [Acorus gramineus]